MKNKCASWLSKHCPTLSRYSLIWIPTVASTFLILLVISFQINCCSRFFRSSNNRPSALDAPYSAEEEEAPLSTSMSPAQALPLSSPLSQDIESIFDSAVYFQHPRAVYSLSYPGRWRGMVASTTDTASGQGYKNLSIYSPDYHVSTDDPDYEGVEFIDSGSKVIVSAQATDSASIRDEYLKTLPFPNAELETKDILLDGDPAIQYKIDYENTKAIITTTLHNGLGYTLSYHYAALDDGTADLDSYQFILNSFKFMTPSVNTTSIDISTWQSYSNSLIPGLSISYPQDWSLDATDNRNPNYENFFKMCTGDCLSLSITHGTVRLFISFYLFWENYGEYCSNKSSYEDIGSGWYRVRTETSFYYSPYVFPNCTRNDSGSMGTFNDDEKDIQIQAGMKFGMCDFFPAALMWSEPPTTEFWGDAALETDIYMKRPTIEGQPTIEELAILDEIVHSLQGVDMMPTLQQDVAVTQDEMNNLSDWISYTDPLYNYGFIYPSTWGSGGSVLQDDQFRYLSSSLFPNRVKVLDHVNRQFCGTSIAIYPEGGLSVNLSDFHPSTTKITSREVTSNSLGEFTILTDWNIPAFPDFEIRVLQLDETAKRILDSLTFPVL